MKKFLIAALCLSAAFMLFSCGEQPKVIPGAVVTIEKSDETNGVVTEGHRVTITSLADWDEFDSDGNFSDNCYNFLNNFIGNSSEFCEFDTVKVGEYEIIRDPDTYELYQLAFNFTVTESALDTLPVGSYRTVVSDIVDCIMTFSGDAPNEVECLTAEEYPVVGVVNDWIISLFCWDFPKYGTEEDSSYLINYLVRHYGDGYLEFEEFKALAKDKFGVEAKQADIDGLLTVIDGKLCATSGGLGGMSSFDVIDIVNTDGENKVTVQFYADVNRFVKSITVEYTIDDNDRFIDCVTVTPSPYKPYGLRSLFGN